MKKVVTKKAKLRRVGGSWMVAVNKAVLIHEGYSLGDEVDVSVYVHGV